MSTGYPNAPVLHYTDNAPQDMSVTFPDGPLQVLPPSLMQELAAVLRDIHSAIVAQNAILSAAFPPKPQAKSEFAEPDYGVADYTPKRPSDELNEYFDRDATGKELFRDRESSGIRGVTVTRGGPVPTREQQRIAEQWERAERAERAQAAPPKAREPRPSRRAPTNANPRSRATRARKT